MPSGGDRAEVPAGDRLGLSKCAPHPPYTKGRLLSSKKRMRRRDGWREQSDRSLHLDRRTTECAAQDPTSNGNVTFAECRCEKVNRQNATRLRRRSGSTPNSGRKSAAPELRRFFRAAGGVAGAVGMRAGAGQLAAIDDQILARGSGACRTSTPGSRACRPHSVPAPTATCPRCAASCRDAASSATDGPSARGCGNQTSPAYPASWPLSSARDDGVAVADLAARRVDEVGAALHLGDQLVVEQVLRLRMQRALIVTTSHTLTIDSTLAWKVRPSSFSTLSGSRCRSV